MHEFGDVIHAVRCMLQSPAVSRRVCSGANSDETFMSAAADLQAGDVEFVAETVRRLQDEPGALLPILHAVQNRLGYVPREALSIIAEALNLSRAEVHGVVSFYHYFLGSPPGRNKIQICRAESCQAMGSRALEVHAKQSLGIDYHQTTADGEFTLLPVYCLGNCACSPSVRIGDDVHGNVDPEKLDELVSNLSMANIKVK